MTHRRDQRNITFRRGPNDHFLVKRPKIFQTAAAPRHDQHIRSWDAIPAVNLVKAFYSRSNFFSGTIALYNYRPDKNMTRETVGQAVENIPYHRTRR